jgi:hypothetical protein
MSMHACEKGMQRHVAGGATETGLRTFFGIDLVFGMPAAQHRIAPFVAAPFVFACKSEPLEKSLCR